MGFGMSLLMTLIITYVNTGFDINYLGRFLKAWSVSLPIAIGTVLIVGPIVKNNIKKKNTNDIKNIKTFNIKI